MRYFLQFLSILMLVIGILGILGCLMVNFVSPYLEAAEKVVGSVSYQFKGLNTRMFMGVFGLFSLSAFFLNYYSSSLKRWLLFLSFLSLFLSFLIQAYLLFYTTVPGRDFRRLLWFLFAFSFFTLSLLFTTLRRVRS